MFFRRPKEVDVKQGGKSGSPPRSQWSQGQEGVRGIVSMLEEQHQDNTNAYQTALSEQLELSSPLPCSSTGETGDTDSSIRYITARSSLKKVRRKFVLVSKAYVVDF